MSNTNIEKLKIILNYSAVGIQELVPYY